MKHLLSGIGVAAVIVIAAPVLAQAAPTSGSPASHPLSPGATSVQLAQAAAQSPAAARPQRPARKAQPAKARGGGQAIFGPTAGDNVANDLNRMELQRLQAGSPAPMMAPRPAPPMPGPRESGGGYIPPSPSGPVSTADPSSMGPRESGGGYIPAPTGPRPISPPPPISQPVR
jgi:hypothetical protein